jgi:hypothetical protein
MCGCAFRDGVKMRRRQVLNAGSRKERYEGLDEGIGK